eukprot:scaffold30032_cov138-Isochrysis_galbana.AAC.15
MSAKLTLLGGGKRPKAFVAVRVGVTRLRPVFEIAAVAPAAVARAPRVKTARALPLSQVEVDETRGRAEGKVATYPRQYPAAIRRFASLLGHSASTPCH